MKGLNLPKEKTFVGPALIWKRIAAFLIDFVIINLVALSSFRKILQGIVPKNYSFSEAYSLLSSSANYTSFITSVSFVMAILIILYFFMLENKMGQTIGKALMKIYVVDAHENASPRSTKADDTLKKWQLLARDIVFIPIFPFVLLWLIDPLFMIFTKTNQRLTEILSKTKVVERYNLGDFE